MMTRQGWCRPFGGLLRQSVTLGGKDRECGLFFLPFFGVNVRGFSRFISGPFQGQNPVTPRVFSRSRQTQNCKLDIIPLFPRRQSTAHNGGQIIGPTTQQPHLTNPTKMFRIYR